MSIKNALTQYKSNVCYNVNRAKLKIKKHDSEILMAAGAVTFIGTIYTAYRAGSKAEQIVKDHKERLATISEAKELSEKEPETYQYDEDLVKMDIRNAYIKTGVDYIKDFAPVFVLATISFGCVLSAKHLMDKKYVGVVAAYNAVSEAFKAYREKVVEEQGDIMDRHYRYGTEVDEITVTEVDENGKKVKKKQLVEKKKDDTVFINDDTTVVFDESNKKHWSKDRGVILSYLRGMENYATDLLRSRGHLMMNEIYDMIGVPQTNNGCVIGWIKEECDNVDFGLDKGDQEKRFLDGDIDELILEFNHCGVIWDKI